jgi:hypothetical protein
VTAPSVGLNAVPDFRMARKTTTIMRASAEAARLLTARPPGLACLPNNLALGFADTGQGPPARGFQARVSSEWVGSGGRGTRMVQLEPASANPVVVHRELLGPGTVDAAYNIMYPHDLPNPGGLLGRVGADAVASSTTFSV